MRSPLRKLPGSATLLPFPSNVVAKVLVDGVDGERAVGVGHLLVEDQHVVVGRAGAQVEVAGVRRADGGTLRYEHLHGIVLVQTSGQDGGLGVEEVSVVPAAVEVEPPVGEGGRAADTGLGRRARAGDAGRRPRGGGRLQ